MSDSFNHNSPIARRPGRRGVTLVELLVVITIMAVLTAILIPQVRIVNKDRNIREAARVVASFFANASQRAVNEGVAGVIIERNANILDADGVPYAGTTLYVMRKVPSYAGDDAGDQAEITANGVNPTVQIAEPFEQADLNIINVNDFISFNYSTVKYRITALATAAGMIDLTLNGGGVLPPLPGAVGDTLPFVIYRQPRKLESSRVDLPAGYLIDLRLSGELNFAPDTTGTVLYDPRALFHEVDATSVTYIFGSSGGVDRYYYNAGTVANPTATLNFLVRAYDTDEPVVTTVLAQPSNLWVTVNNLVGSANVAYCTPVDSALPLATQITTARTIAQGGQSAIQ